MRRRRGRSSTASAGSRNSHPEAAAIRDRSLELFRHDEHAQALTGALKELIDDASRFLAGLATPRPRTRRRPPTPPPPPQPGYTRVESDRKVHLTPDEAASSTGSANCRSGPGCTGSRSTGRSNVRTTRPFLLQVRRWKPSSASNGGGRAMDGRVIGVRASRRGKPGRSRLMASRCELLDAHQRWLSVRSWRNAAIPANGS